VAATIGSTFGRQGIDAALATNIRAPYFLTAAVARLRERSGFRSWKATSGPCKAFDQMAGELKA
jgi:hypothetical protein